MSWRAVAWALQQRTGSPAAKLVLAALASHANAHHEAWPSQVKLADETELARATVQRSLQSLKEGGLISTKLQLRQRGKWPLTIYRLPVTVPHSEARHRASQGGPDRASLSTPPCLTQEHHRASQRGTNLSREPSSEPFRETVNQKNGREPSPASDRKNRPTYEEIKQRHGPTFGLKLMER